MSLPAKTFSRSICFPRSQRMFPKPRGITGSRLSFRGFVYAAAFGAIAADEA
jgi:hypothetical protein